MDPSFRWGDDRKKDAAAPSPCATMRLDRDAAARIWSSRSRLKNPALSTSAPAHSRPSVELFLPKLVTVLREGYDLSALRADVVAGGLELRVLRGPPAPAEVDVDRLAQVVGNLVANASRYARSRVVVECRPVGADPDGPAGVAGLVTNDGPSIAAEDLPHVFERLYRAGDQPERKESGSGLGLAIVRELVGAMGGRVGVTSPPTGGATFWFRLPLPVAAT